MKELRLGIIGLSEGNGHPYSWSAIFNGYDPEAMRHCPFPAIPAYLSRQSFPQDKIAGAKVTHVWTQKRTLSREIAHASRIDTVVDDYREMIGEVDAVLLARDDAESHQRISAPFLEAGLPVYVDKPLALSVREAQQILSLQQYDGQIFTCSAFHYAREFQLDERSRRLLGQVRHIYGAIGRSWEKYGVHVVEPALRLLGAQGAIARTARWREGEITTVSVAWETGAQATFSTLGTANGVPFLRIAGTRSAKDLFFGDTFAAFKAALGSFVQGVVERRPMIAQGFVLDVVRVIEAGCHRAPLALAGGEAG
jgi:predicted dehydrogenase